MPRAPVVVIGVGNPVRADDGAGPEVISLLSAEGLDARGVDLIALDGEPARLMEAWRGRERAILVDAARTGRPPGAIVRVSIDDSQLPSWMTSHSTHGAGVAEAVALGRALDVLPAELIVYGIEYDDLSLGNDMSLAVQASLCDLTAQVALEATR